MSRAFVKEDAGPPEADRAEFVAYRVLSADDPQPQVAHQDDDLLALMRWALSRPSGLFLLRDRQNTLLAEVG